ncbi:MAG TPA: enoyl-CoA hydratase/isomerase family protein, partial [Alphaproteobacteria bacterium]|nr:enoyl-CoA hydratase/isomerase family protein [Alphaproteobacteria bacterium]
YGLNHLLYHYPKPIVALAQGITMGGGYGLAGNANIRVAFEDTQFAMPESKIGFFPDVGAVAHLAKAPAHIGRYLAMSGNSLDGASMTLAGLADHYVQKSSANNILADIVKAQPQDRAAVEAVVKDHALTLSETKEFENLKHFCAAHFGFSDAKTILESLVASNDSMAASVLADIRARSPLSVLVALGHYNRAAEAGDFDSVIERDLQLCAHHIRGHDLYEGIRALLLDKDKNPRWEHARIEDIRAETAEGYFQPIVPKLEPL